MAVPQRLIGIIGGSAFYRLSALQQLRETSMPTPYGSVDVSLGNLNGHDIAFIARHGRDHRFAPHTVPYRAQMFALKELGAHSVLATASVGGMHQALEPGDLVVLDQFIDMTHSRPTTYFDGPSGVRHVDMTAPYCPNLRSALLRALAEDTLRVEKSGTYVCTEGPRLETPAEIRAYRAMGGLVVGQTQVPEVVLARELGLCYGAIAIVANLAAGMGTGPLAQADILAAMAAVEGRVSEALARTLDYLPHGHCENCAKEVSSL